MGNCGKRSLVQPTCVNLVWPPQGRSLLFLNVKPTAAAAVAAGASDLLRGTLERQHSLQDASISNTATLCENADTVLLSNC